MSFVRTTDSSFVRSKTFNYLQYVSKVACEIKERDYLYAEEKKKERRDVDEILFFVFFWFLFIYK